MNKNIEKIIDEMNYCRKNNQCISAMALAFMLIDACSKAKYPSEYRNKIRFTDWWGEYISSSIRLSGDMIYALRCNFVHQATNFSQTEMTDGNKNEFLYEFIIDYSREPNEYEIYCDEISYDETNCVYTINPQRFCFVIEQCVKGFLKEIDDSAFDFMKYTIKGI